MYSTCLFCAGPLGRNESLEHFPVGRRLAFDAVKGRLWVVCPSCARWNLTPLEARWEAIEEAERAYRNTRERAATENIGLAKLREGTELVRIGQPQLPEFAAWRYGRIFRQRFAKWQFVSWGGMAASLAHSGSQLLANRSIGPALFSTPAWTIGSSLVVMSGAAYIVRQQYRQRAIVRDAQGNWLRLRAGHVKGSFIAADPAQSAWSLVLRHVRRPAGRGGRNEEQLPSTSERNYTMLSGDHAMRALTKLLPIVNRAGSSEPIVKMSVDLVTEFPNLQPILAGASANGKRPMVSRGANPLSSVSPVLLLALEMSLHEADERRAIEGELRTLEERWREAEEIAAIADRMLLPAFIDDRLRRMRAP